MKSYKVGENILSIEIINEIISNNSKISLSSIAKKRIKSSQVYLNKRINNSDDPIYGINTGFGSLYNQKISLTNSEGFDNGYIMKTLFLVLVNAT